MNSEQRAEGYDIPAVESWIRQHVPGFTPPFKWRQLQGGHSNLTFQLTASDGAEAVIRRPPQGELLPKAHDMSREWALISALGPTAVPVPEALGFCADISITGASFYLMGLIDGHPLTKPADTVAWVPESERPGLAHSFFDVLAELHELDPDEIGLGDLGKTDSYVGRQLKTWYRSWTSSVDAARYDDPRAHELQRYFLEHLPEQEKARVVHGDYGLHNCLIGAQGTVVAVVDWEISTLGDPLADFAYALNFWPETPSAAPADSGPATAAPGFPSRRELAEHYARRTGRSLDKLDYYSGFNSWKSAAIVHGVYARYMAGQKSTTGVDTQTLRNSIDANLTLAEQAVNRSR